MYAALGPAGLPGENKPALMNLNYQRYLYSSYRAPRLNPEVGGSAGTSAVSRDNHLAVYQNEIGAV